MKEIDRRGDMIEMGRITRDIIIIYQILIKNNNKIHKKMILYKIWKIKDKIELEIQKINKLEFLEREGKWNLMMILKQIT